MESDHALLHVLCSWPRSRGAPRDGAFSSGIHPPGRLSIAPGGEFLGKPARTWPRRRPGSRRPGVEMTRNNASGPLVVVCRLAHSVAHFLCRSPRQSLEGFAMDLTSLGLLLSLGLVVGWVVQGGPGPHPLGWLGAMILSALG